MNKKTLFVGILLVLLISGLIIVIKSNGGCIVKGDPSHDSCVLKICATFNIDWRYCQF